MVPRIARKEIVLPFVFVIVVGMAAFYTSHRGAPLVYSATNDALDLAIVAGIKETENAEVASARAAIVPHHLVASQSIALGVKAVAKKKPSLVVIISPDHFGKCETLLCTTKGTYTTFFGDVSVNNKAEKMLLASPLVSESHLFTEEHGVYTIVPYIKHYLPEAQILPIVISQKTRGDEKLRQEMIDLLRPLANENDVAFVISSDFSHYLPLAETKAKDTLTQRSFCSGNTDELVNLENPSQSDCPLCLFALVTLAKEEGYFNPVLLAHTNSAELLHDNTAKEITSHFAFALSDQTTPRDSCTEKKEIPVSSTTILFVGDMMFDRYIRQVSETHGGDFIFSCIDPLLKSASLVVGNLEGPITPNPSTSKGTVIGSAENYHFTFPISTAKLLAEHHVGVVSIGNNHITDQGMSGLSSTQQYLDGAHVGYFGGVKGNTSIYRTTLGTMAFSFIGYNQFGGETVEDVSKEIDEEHLSGRKVIVFPHWGEEYTGATESMQVAARTFVVHGADLIIGSHPHVIQSHEIIGSTPVYYSLGNFIFDQYFEENVTEGLTLLIHFSPDGMKIEEKPVTLLKDGRTCEE